MKLSILSQKFLVLFIMAALLPSVGMAQFLPKGLTDEERSMLPLALPEVSGRSITTPPVGPVRVPGEWEEVDGLVIRWNGTWVRNLLRDIARHAKEEATVYIVTPSSFQSDVQAHLAQGGVSLDNIVFVNEPSNSIWIRDYGQWTIYDDMVGDASWVDWIYNRPRPQDDAMPVALADMLDVPLYRTLIAPNDLVHTGGNFMVDGFGTAFSSNLVLDENAPGNPFGVSGKNEAQVDQIMNSFMGIDRYVKMTNLPYDGIHHIDMHMKLLDEETLLVGQYPPGVADGPQIEANLQYVLDNFMSVYGTPYKVIRIPMPPHNGQYPNNPNAHYRTYTNSVFVNKTILVPTYEEQWDTTALRIYREALPGYKVVGLDCNQVISASGAIHCITKEVASKDPLLISHQPLRDTPQQPDDFEVNALVTHASGIADATLYWTTDTTAGYGPATMTLTDASAHTWTGYIPTQPAGTEVFYYIHAEANSGKQQVRPITAPQGWWKFNVTGTITGIDDQSGNGFTLYPNPAAQVVNLQALTAEPARIALMDMAGRVIFSEVVTDGRMQMDVAALPEGLYIVRFESASASSSQRLIIIK